MRIIAGLFKGKKILEPADIKTRPLKDLTKESIFNIIQHSNKFKVQLVNANILDIFSGVGSFGIECISRGAKKVTFIEQDEKASNLLKNNLNQLFIDNKTQIYNKMIEEVLMEEMKQKFDIFFFDPPFADFDFYKNLNTIKKKKICKKKHIVIIHREKKTKDNFDNLLKIVLTKDYGRSRIIFGLFN